jgi:signal transduction histidine kinase
LKLNSIKYKILFWFTSIIFIILFVFSYALYFFIEKSINQRIEESLHQKAVSIHLDLKKDNLNKHLTDNNLNGVEVKIIRDDIILYQTKQFTLKNSHNIYRIPKLYLDEINEYQVDAVYSYKIKEPFEGNILLYQKGIHNQAEDIEHILSILDPILLIILIFLANRMIDKILVPIKNVTKEAKQITISDLSNIIDVPKNKDEITDLINSFNNMVIRLKEGIEKLDNFNRDVSHELKTPLTVIKGEAEVTLKKKRDPDYYIKSTNMILNAANQLSKITDEMLLFTKYTKQNVRASFIECDLDSILINIMDQYESELKDKNIKLNIHNLEHIKYYANQYLINCVFSNLLDNAIKYSSLGGYIDISLYKEFNNIHFIIKDRGIGIPSDKLSNVTDKFYRVDASRNKNISGFGLGLAIVKSCVELHNGILKINSIENKGTTVTVDFLL